MKKIKFLIILCITSCIVLALVGCGGSALSRPTKLQINDAYTRLTWNPVMGARSYVVEIDGKSHNTNDYYYDLSNLEPNKNHKFRVKAKGDRVNNSDSVWSVTLEKFKEYENGLRFKAINANTAYQLVGAGTARGDEVEVPKSFRGLPVVSIASNALQKSKFKKITLPDTITSIGEGAFTRSDLLEEINLPASLNSIGKNAFSGCSSLKSIKIPDNVYTVPEYAFSECVALKSVEFGANTTTISQSAFTNCSSLQSVKLTDKITKVERAAFSYCTSLEKFESGKGLTTLLSNNFEGCSKLHDVKLNEGLLTIYDDVFLRCAALEEIDLPSTVTSIGSRCFAACSELKRISFGDNLTRISNDAFYNTKIWKDAEQSGQKLLYINNWLIHCFDVKVTEPYTIKEGTLGIAEYAFASDAKKEEGSDEWIGSNIPSVTIPDSVKYINYAAFYNSINMQTLVIGDGVEEIGQYAFAGCDKLQYLTIGKNVKVIDDYAFYKCINLGFETTNGNPAYIEFPSTLEHVGTYAFKDTYYWKSYGNVVYAGGWVVGVKDRTALTELDIAPSMPYGNPARQVPTIGISKYTFYKCTKLKKATIPDTVKYVNKYAFYWCTTLETLDFSSNEQIEAIGDYAFYMCVKLTRVTLPSSVKSIGRSAFYECRTMENVGNLDKVESIDAYAFFKCSSLDNVKFGKNLTYVGDRSFYSSGISSVELASDLETTGVYAFAGCPNLKTVVIGDGVKSVGRYSFIDNNEIEKVTISDTVTAIGDYAFMNNAALKEVTFGNNLESIGNSSFAACSSLERLVLPKSLKSIGNLAFRNCAKLNSVVLHKETETLNMHVFIQCTDLTIYTDAESDLEGWHMRWNTAYRPVVYGCKLSADGTYVESFVKTANNIANAFKSNTIVAPEREGYAFDGWYNQAQGGSKVCDAQDIFTVADGTTLYARWSVSED